MLSELLKRFETWFHFKKLLWTRISTDNEWLAASLGTHVFIYSFSKFMLWGLPTVGQNPSECLSHCQRLYFFELIFPGKKNFSSLVFSAEQKMQNLNLIYLSKHTTSITTGFWINQGPKPLIRSDFRGIFLLQVPLTFCFSAVKKGRDVGGGWEWYLFMNNVSWKGDERCDSYLCCLQA